MATLAPAEALASKMLAASDVRVRWSFGSAARPRNQAQCTADRLTIKIMFAQSQRAGLSRNHLAYTYPYDLAAPRVIVNYENIPRNARESEAMSSVVLAHIMVHEVAHVLQRISRHSDTGLMKANWSLADYAAMQTHPLPFAPEDIILIHLGRLSWERSMCYASGPVSEQRGPQPEPPVYRGAR